MGWCGRQGKGAPSPGRLHGGTGALSPPGTLLPSDPPVPGAAPVPPVAPRYTEPPIPQVWMEPKMRRALLTLLLLLVSPPPTAARPDGPVSASEARGRPLWPPLVPPAPEQWRARRDEPPLSIDLTFHLLRHLLLLARAQSQRAQADSNRLILDAVGR
uniref:Uncharacterized protein n=1 Tax=Melopsittacus undulatus TaxID=13146 RepID=A0A8C6ISS4_MELUD